MRVVAAACLLVLLLADVPRVSPRKIDSRPENPAEAEDEGYGFITTTISSLSSFLGLGKASDDDADHKKEVEQPAENEADKADNDLASPKGGWSALDTPEEKTSASADSGAQPDPGLQADEAPKEESGKPDGGKPDKPANKPRDKDDPDSLLEKERSGGRPDKEDTREDREKDKEDKEDDKDKDKKEDKGDKEGDKEDKDREELEEKLNEISEKEDKILDKLDKEDKEELERDPPRRRNSSGLVLVNRGPGGSGSSVILPRKPIGRGPGNSSVALMSDRQFQPYSPGVNALATHMRTCDNCLVTWDSFQCPMNDMAIELKKWITELEELLSFGCQLEGCDGSRKCCHRRDPVFERAVREMTDMARQMYNTFQSACSNCPRDGGWTEWCEWGSCSVTCGPGSRTRSRQCSNPTPKGGGRQCLGLARETLPCSNPSCCTNGNWGFWGPWSQCSASCGSGSRDRRRRCDSPAPNHCGSTCPGSESDREICYTNIPCAPLCEDGNWGPWQPWSGCSVTCGSGTESRMRRCDNPAPNFCGQRCSGAASDTQPCHSGRDCCVDGNWGNWGPWSRCPVSCGTGMKERRRRCENPSPSHCGRPCPGPDSERFSCNAPPCIICIPRDGVWTSWSYWSSCSATCGRGTQERTRRCQPPNECGRPCVVGPARESQPCEEQSCCVNGNWGSWGPWSTPSATCGMVVRNRQRQCDRPRPNYCGSQCLGPDRETDNYDTNVPCIVCEDGNWGSWGPWGRPSVSCGMSMRERRRRCDNPPPNYCGRSCPGVNTDSENYDTRVPCPPVCEDGNWGSWGPWGRPSVSCGMSVRERRRRCDSPPPNFCGRSCPGVNTDTDNYDTRVPCPPVCEDGNWGSWGPWGRPSSSCGMSVRERRRRCDNPPPNFCGRSCPGLNTDTDNYDTRVPCEPICVPLDGNWSLWSRWSPCSATCDGGTRSRYRSCTNPSPNQCGEDCRPRNADRETQPCNMGRCCVPRDGGWSPWSSWSPCPVTCGTGRVERSRSCSNPPPNECGSQCRGSSRDSQTCDRGSCCVFRTWENWGPWSQPGVTCGTASRERRRRCALPLGGVDCGQPCPGPDFERESYDTGVPCIVCIDGNWGSWFPWGSCSQTCGGGTQDRQRSCNNPRPNSCGRECMGPAKDMRRCNEHSCCIPENGNWGSWTPWSSCSASCGSGMRERSRECNNPRRRCGGRDCPGPRRETDVCSGGDCCVNGNWGNWGPWGRPTVTCGTYLSERRRRCDRPTPNFCGRDCPGSAVDTQVSDTGIPCRVCIDGNWGSWEPWSMCTVTCGMGPRERRRRCNDPSPNECGRTCPGLAFETGLQRCGPELEVGNWSPWGPWGSCSRSCGRGQQTRRRRCDVGRCGSRCPGSDSDTQGCDEGPCCVPREWTPWSPWSACDASCGRGRRTRQRTCRSVGYGDDCGSRCPGRGEEVDSCRGLPPCEPPWGPWGGCSATCEGFGVRERRRISTGRFEELVGRQTETERCQVFTPPCPQPAEWTQWNEWCPCDCKKGVRARRRTCEQRGPSFGRGSPVDISNCGGPAREEDYCDVRQACPPCVEDCTGRLDGDYPACTSCSDYLKCSNGRAGMLSCGGNGNEYDAFIRKCVPPPSPSCTLVDCVTSCARLADGTYPSCSGCGFYIRCSNGREGQLSCPSGQEFNAHSGQCVSGRSPTCVRAIRRSLEFMYRDAPADSYFPADKLSDEERKALYLELRKKVGVAAKFNRTDEDFLAREEERKKEEEEAKKKAEEEKKKAEEEKKKAEEEEKKAEEEKKEEARNEIEEEEEDEKNKKAGSVVIEEEEEGGAGSKAEEKKKAHKLDNTTKFKGGKFVCQKDCTNVKMGRFQSCRGCHYFLVCTKHGVPRHVKCPRHKSWDDIKKKCRRHSDTCKDENTTTP